MDSKQIYAETLKGIRFSIHEKGGKYLVFVGGVLRTAKATRKGADSVIRRIVGAS